MSYFCYLLLCIPDGKQTYVGATMDPDRRLKQHNGKLKGGARSTAIKVAQGSTWERICYIKDIPSWQAALQIEWKWKNLGRTKFRSIKNPATRRLYALKTLLSLERPTKNAIPFIDYKTPLEIVWDSGDYQKEYEAIII